MSNPLSDLQPALLAKVGSIVGHLQEYLSAHGHRYDLEAAQALLYDPQVRAWLEDMRKLSLVPAPRGPL